jgi:SAM-dependent methyltransferase
MTLRDAWRQESSNWIRFARAPEHDRYYFLLNLPRFLELLPPPGDLTVDVGCGEGRIGRELTARGHRVVGLDSSEPVVRALVREEPPGIGVVGDSSRLPFRSKIADVVISFMSLQDMDDPSAAIHEVGRVLVPGGTFCFALLHPFISAGDFSADRTSFIVDESYWAERQHAYHTDRGGIELTFWQKHRPLSVYTTALQQAGFVVEAMLEPRPGDAEVGQLGSTRLMPVFLHVRARSQ